jgi:ATP-dependent RNA helicase SUPV3L1/SUV3
VVAQVEAHSFEPLDYLCWRNSDLALGHVDALLDSLLAPPPGPGLVRGNEASDLTTLVALTRDPEIRRLARGRSMVRTLWEVCQVPDFRKLADETHNRLCARIFTHLATEGTVPTDWLAAQIASLARPEGDIDTLMQRLAGVRVWSYIAARSDWVRDAITWQGRAREVEDLLSDALHEQLTARFVDRRAAHLMRRLEETEGTDLLSAVTRRGEVVVEGHLVGHVAGFGFVPDPTAAGEERRVVLRAARRALRAEMPRRVTEAEAAPDAAFSLTSDHRILWAAHGDTEAFAIARLRPGTSLLRPGVEILDSEFLDGAQRERLRARVQRWIGDAIRADLAPLFEASARAEADRALRGPMHRLQEALGLIPGADEGGDPQLRRQLKALGVKAGRFALFLPALLKPRATAMRARLWALHHRIATPTLPAAGLVSLPIPPDWPGGFAEAMGWLEAGPVLIRLDVAERIAAELAWAARRGAVALPAGLASRFSVPAALLPVVLRQLGLRVVPGGSLAADVYGPPPPPMLLPTRRRRPARPDRPVRIGSAHGPFAALAVLRQ